MVRAGAARRASCPTGRRCPTTSFSPHQDLVSERLATLYQHHAAATSTSRSCRRRPRCYRLAPPSYLAARHVLPQAGRDASTSSALRAQLALAGYSHVTQVVAPGEYCVRGGLIDLFPMGSALPYRIDLVRRRDRDASARFDVDTQRTHLPGERGAPAAGARVPARRRRRRRAFRAPLPRSVRRRSVASRRSTRTSRNGVAAGGHRVLPAAVLRADRDAHRLPAAATTRRRVHGDVHAAIEQFWQRHRIRATRCCAATATQPAAAAARALPDRRRVLRRAQAVRARRARTRSRRSTPRTPPDAPTAPLPPVAVDRRADDPLHRAASASLERVRRPRAAARRKRRAGARRC